MLTKLFAFLHKLSYFTQSSFFLLFSQLLFLIRFNSLNFLILQLCFFVFCHTTSTLTDNRLCGILYTRSNPIPHLIYIYLSIPHHPFLEQLLFFFPYWFSSSNSRLFPSLIFIFILNNPTTLQLHYHQLILCYNAIVRDYLTIIYSLHTFSLSFTNKLSIYDVLPSLLEVIQYSFISLKKISITTSSYDNAKYKTFSRGKFSLLKSYILND